MCVVSESVVIITEPSSCPLSLSHLQSLHFPFPHHQPSAKSRHDIIVGCDSSSLWPSSGGIKTVFWHVIVHIWGRVIRSSVIKNLLSSQVHYTISRWSVITPSHWDLVPWILTTSSILRNVLIAEAFLPWNKKIFYNPHPHPNMFQFTLICSCFVS